jgi:hypothetical protein
VDNSKFASDSQVVRFLAPYKNELDAKMNIKIAELHEDFTKKQPECLLGNWMADAIKWHLDSVEKIKVDFPPSEARVRLIKFYDVDGILNETAINKIASKKCDKFTPAQLQEVIVRSEINAVDPNLVIDQMVKEIENYEKNFNERARTGIGMFDD